MPAAPRAAEGFSRYLFLVIDQTVSAFSGALTALLERNLSAALIGKAQGTMFFLALCKVERKSFRQLSRSSIAVNCGATVLTIFHRATSGVRVCLLYELILYAQTRLTIHPVRIKATPLMRHTAWVKN